jgi:TPR repeat protein
MENYKKITGNRLVDQLDTYQSANSDHQAIKNNFIVRIDEFKLIIDDLRNKKSKDPLQHELILGRRGSGKSTLLKRIQIEIEEDPSLSKKYIAINLAEEQAGIYRLFDLWLEVIKESGSKLQITFSLKDYDSFNNDQEYTRYLYEEINKALNTKKKKIVLLLDNLDRIIENFDDDGNLLREMLHNYNDIQIIGGSTRMDEHFWRYDKPFYEFFRRHRLGPLSFDEIHVLLNHWSQLMDLPQLMAFTMNNPGKIEAVRILTDGLPRTLQFFIDILLQDSTLYGFDYIRKVMDRVTPLYQERLNNLPAPQRKIVLEAAFIWEACTAKQLVLKCNMESKLISAHLKQLSNIGIIETLSTSKKNHLYRLSERFFNMWLIVTQGNPEQKRKAKWLTIFIETWYDTAHLKTLVADHIANLQEQKVPYERALILTKAFSQSKYTSTIERDEMLEYTNKLKTSTTAANFLELPKKYSDIVNEINKLIEEGKMIEAHKLTDELENENDGVKFYIKGGVFAREGNIKKAENYYLQAIEKGHAGALNNLAILYKKEGRNQEAQSYYLLAIEKGNKEAINNLANLYKNEGRNLEAKNFYLLAIEKGSTDALNNLAILYKNEGRNQDAENYYLLAIEKGNTDALNNLANLYKYQSRNQEAENYYLLAVKKGNIGALFNLALLYDDEGKSQEAENYYLQAIEKGHINALNNLAIFYYENNLHKKDALQLINKYKEQNTGPNAIKNSIVIEVWNAVFENIEERMWQAIIDSNYENLNWFFTNLLIQEQVQIVSNVFANETHGKTLQDKYALLYYVLLLLTNKNLTDNLELRIPPEVMPTVLEIKKDIEQKQAMYASGEIG